MHIDPWTMWFVGMFGLLIPYTVVASSIRRRKMNPAFLPARWKIVLQILIMQSFFAGAAFLAARQSGIDLLASGKLSGKSLALAVGTVAAMLIILPLRWRGYPQERKRRILQTRPQQPRDLTWWFAVSLAAGTAEELAYRGVLFVMLSRLTGSWWSAALLTALAFGLGHANQGWASGTLIGAFSIALQVLVLLTGSLFAAMAVHFVYDFLAGIVYLKLARDFQQAGAQAQSA